VDTKPPLAAMWKTLSSNIWKATKKKLITCMKPNTKNPYYNDKTIDDIHHSVSRLGTTLSATSPNKKVLLSEIEPTDNSSNIING
jgi:hypothetical protein